MIEDEAQLPVFSMAREYAALTPLGASLRLPDLTVEQAERACLLSRRRVPFQTDVAGTRLEVSPYMIPDGAVIEGDDRVDIALSVDGRPGTLRLPVSIANRLIESIEPGLSLNALDEECAAWMLELALQPVLEVLEASAGVGVRFVALTFAARPMAEKGFWGFRCAFGAGGAQLAFLRLDRRDAQLLEQFIISQPLAPRALGQPMIDLSFQVGAASLTMMDLRTLQSGDTVLLDQTGVAKGYLNIAVGASWRLIGRLNNTGGIVLQGALVRADEADARVGEGMDEAEQQTPAADEPLPETAIDALPVKLVFELGRLEIELEQLRTLNEGYIFNLGRSLTHPVDILVSGRRIGAGELVRVGESVGVRISRLFSHDGSTV